MVRVKFDFKKESASYAKKKKDIKLPKLVHIYWDITYRCPLGCEHCYAKPLRWLDKELDTMEVKKVIDYLSTHRISLVTFTGGEPLARSDIFEIIDYANKRGLHTSLVTAGFSPEKIKKLADLNVKRMQFSLDSQDATTYNRMRGIEGLYEKVLQSIKIAIELGIRTSICTTIMRQNYNDIPKIFDLALKLGVDEYRLMRLMPCGVTREQYDQLSIKFEEYVKLFETLVRKYLALERPILIDVEEPYYLIEKFKNTDAEKIIYYRGCLQGEAVCTLTADGKIIPCPIGNYKEFIAGDIRKDDLLEVWNSSPVFKYFREVKLIQVCNTCKYGDLCKGGCRCAAFGFYGKLDAPDPICPQSYKSQG